MVQYALRESGRAIADGNGRAVVTIGPFRAFEQWHVKNVAIQSTSSTLVPTLRVYLGGEAETNLIGGSFTGTLDNAQADQVLMSGQTLVFVWSGADAGANCVVTLGGVKIHP